VALLTIRNNSRFAVRHAIRLRGPGGEVLDGLLVEISLGGCRVSNVDARGLRMHDEVTAVIDGFEDMACQVRWLGDGVIGLRLHRPLHCDRLERIIGHCRMTQRGEELRYGT